MNISSAASLIRQCIVEVERKFKPTADFISRLRQNACPAHHPFDRTVQVLPFQTLVGPATHNFEDTYYDADHVLSTRGIWVRCRGGDWQAKIRHGGNFINSSFQELSGREAVTTMIQKYFPKAQLHASGASGISEIARFTTYREAWRANDKFDIVIDRTDFGHVVGEVELTQELEGESGQALEDGEKERTSKKLDCEIEEFMRYHAWAFPTEEPVGKLSVMKR